ncbi:MAG TPA: sigma factor [Pyrinomonadaceae bacterium]|nr:sigma factor [Pyrinomonadaceae bacterium]
MSRILANRSVLKTVEMRPNIRDAETLLRAIAAGDKTAVAGFNATTSGLLFGLLLRILGDTATAEQVLSTVYDEVSLQAAGFEKNDDSLLTWLITITHRRALEHLCSSKEDQQFLISVGLATALRSGPEQKVRIRKSAHRKLVSATLNSLSPVERKMIELAYFSRMTPSAIATKLGQSPAVVTTGLQCGILGLYNLFRSYGSLTEA